MQESNQVKGEILRKYREAPVFFVEHALGHKTWSKQREILWSVRDNEKTAVRASHGVSKTYTAAEIAVWFLSCIPNSKVITTAPTWTQIKMLLWSEINSIYANSRIRLEGECLSTEIKTEEHDHYAFGFSTDKPARAEGWHAPAILFIFDEAKGIPQWMWDAARGAMTGGICRWLVVSTTDGVQVGEQYHKIFNSPNSDWNKIHISAFDSPYVTGEKFRSIEIPDLKRPDRFNVAYTAPADVHIQIATPKYIADCKANWGEDSPLYKTKVLGEIHDASADSIIKLSQVNQMFRNWENSDFNDEGAIEIGVDVARGGSDDTVMYKRKGLKVLDRKVIPPKGMPEKEKLVYVADEVGIFAGQDKKIRIKVDDTGVGGGVTDILQHNGFEVVPVNFASEASDADHYPSAVSEMWFEVGKIIGEIACPEYDRLAAELVNRKSKNLDKKGRRVVESKDDYKERHGSKSPDDADAFLLAFYEPKPKGGGAAVAQSDEEVF
jgi:phage terminase large subunit